jgi:osmotically-inducible protein OsmY
MTMQGHDDIEQHIQAALERESRVNLHRWPISIRRIEEGTVVLMGEIENIEAKRVAVHTAQSVAGVHRIVDRLRLRRATRLEDGAIRDAVWRHLSGEPVFLRAAISCKVEGDTDMLTRHPDGADTAIDVSIAEATVTLRGHVLSLSHKRLAGVLAWWTPGCRDVVNELDIRPPEEDNDDEISDAVLLVLDKDPLVHTDQIAIRVRDGRVRLSGLVSTEEEKRMASLDAWYIDGVRDVVNELDVHSASAGRDDATGKTNGFGLNGRIRDH